MHILFKLPEYDVHGKFSRQCRFCENRLEKKTYKEAVEMRKDLRNIVKCFGGL
jgi:hypothetical protein